VGAIIGRLPTPEEYMAYANDLDSMSAEIYRYMNFNEIQSFQALAEDGQKIAATLIEEVA
jgi:aconitate hydratase 2/2-methylisocitrate dehydratase